MGKIDETLHALKIVSKMGRQNDGRSAEERRREQRESRLQKLKDRRDNQEKTLIRFTYDDENDEYIWDERTHIKMKDIPRSSVHVTGRKNTYFWTDIWDELTWPKEGQSAIHMYLWTINEKINPDAISEKKGKHADIDMRQIMIYGAVGIVVLMIAFSFLNH